MTALLMPMYDGSKCIEMFASVPSAVLDLDSIEISCLLARSQRFH